MTPEFLTSVLARTALETPQIVLTWDFSASPTTNLSSVSWPWDNLALRRSDEKYPEGAAEGDNVLAEAYSVDPTSSVGDVGVSGFKEYYYSLFFKFTEHNTSLVSLNQNIERLGPVLGAVYQDERETILSATDGSTSTGSPDLDSTGSSFLTDGVQAGFILEITEGGADDGFYRILSVNAETQVTLDSNLTLNASNVDFTIYTDHDRFWIAGIDFHRHASLWRWDSKTGMVDRKIDLNEILDLDEFVSAIAFTGIISTVQYVAFVTPKRYVRLPVSTDLRFTPETSDITETWLLDNMSASYEVVGAFLDLSVFAASDTVYILDNTNKEIKLLLEADGSSVSSIDITGLEDTSALRGLAPDYGNSDILIGNKNYIYSVDETAATPDAGDVRRLTYVRELLSADIGFYQDPLTSTIYICIVDDQINRLQTYTVEVGRAYLWQQSYVADSNTVALYHLEENSGAITDQSQYSNDGTNNGMTYEATGRFNFGLEADAVTEYVDISAISGEFDGDEGTVELWFKAATTDELDSGNKTLLDLRVDANNLVRIAIVGGQLTFEYIAGGTSETIAAAHPSIDTEFHHYMIDWSSSADEVKAWVDFTQFGSTQTGLGTWAR
jgi:hypothetical protein